MAIIWKINGSTPADLDIENLAMELVSQDVDRFSFSAPGRALDAADLFDYDDDIVLSRWVDAAETVWFRGKVFSAPHSGSPNTEDHGYEVRGPWQKLNDLNFEQEWNQYGGGTDTKTHVILGRDADDNDLAVGVVVKEILDYIISKGLSISYVQTELDALSSVAPYDDRTDISCAEALRTMLRWYPDASTWFDYSSATPVLHIKRRGAATAVQYDIAAGDPNESLNIVARNDIVRTGVMINYETQDSESQWNAVDRDIYPGGTTSGFSTLQLTVVIGQSGTLETAPVGLAQTLHEAVSVLHYEGRFRLSEEECQGGIAPGNVLNLSNGITAWATMRAVVQSVSFNLDAGATEIVFGPPQHLGLQDYINLLIGNRNRNAGSGSYSGGYEPPATGIASGTDDGDLLMWEEAIIGGGSWVKLARPTVASVLVCDGSEAPKWLTLVDYKYLTRDTGTGDAIVDHVKAYSPA